MVNENAGSFVAAVVASQAADFGYTVTFETSDGTAIGKQGVELYFLLSCTGTRSSYPLSHVCTPYSHSKIVILSFVTEKVFASMYSYPDNFSHITSRAAVTAGNLLFKSILKIPFALMLCLKNQNVSHLRLFSSFQLYCN